ncbi:MAG: AsmA protein [Saprospiraceae bacterium]|jgi:AsmA protein
MKLLKWAFYLLVIVLLLAVAAGFFIINKVDPNDYKDEISEQVKAQTGRTFVIDGDLSWSFYPRLGFEVGSLSLDNREGFAPAKMLSAQGAKIHVAVMPLINKKLEIGRIDVQQLVLNLSVDAQGNSNWADLVGSSVEAESSQSTDAPTEGGAVLSGLIVKGVNIADGQVNWDDQTAGQQLNISAFNLETGEIVPGQAVSFSLGAQVDGNVLAQSTQIKVSGTLDINEALDGVNLSGTRISFVQDQMDAEMGIAMLDFQTATNKLQVQTVSLEGRYDVIPMKGEIAQLDFDLNENLLTTSQQAYEVDLLGVKSTLSIPDLRLSLAEERLTVPAISISQGDAKIDLDAEISNLFSDLQATGSISTNSLKLREIFPSNLSLSLDEFSDAALQDLQIESRFQASLDSMSLSDLVIRMDESNIMGSFSMLSFTVPAYRFQLAVDKLNADNYIPASSEEAAEEAGATGAVVLPFAALKGLDVKGKIEIADFEYQGLLSKNLVIDTDTNLDSITISPLRADLYGGESVNDITYDISGDAPKMNFKTSLANIKLSPFLQAMDLGDRFEGLANINADVNTYGLTDAEFISNMNGEIRINLDDGAIVGANIQKSLMGVANLFKSLNKSEVKSNAEVGDKTEFSNFSALVKVVNGVLISNNIDLKAPAIRLKGSGNVDLNTENLDLKMVVAIVKTFEGQGGQSLKELKGLEIPLAITGDLAAPKIGFDTAALFKQQLKNELAKEVTKKYGVTVDEETGEEVAPQDALKAKIKEEKAKLKKKLLKGLF